jgi:hypothetical protein
MSTASRIWLALAGFLLIAGAVYGITSHEVAGAPLLLVGGATFCYLWLVGRSVVRRTEIRDESQGQAEEGEVHVASTIWPFVFSIAGAIIAIGLIVNVWILVIGALVFALAAAGWFREVLRSHAHADRP